MTRTYTGWRAALILNGCAAVFALVAGVIVALVLAVVS